MLCNVVNFMPRYEDRIVSTVQFQVTRSIEMQCEHLDKHILLFVSTYFWYFLSLQKQPFITAQSQVIQWRRKQFASGGEVPAENFFMCPPLFSCAPTWGGTTIVTDWETIEVSPSVGSAVCTSTGEVPRAGSGFVRMDPLRFLAGYRTRRLNQV